MGKEVAGYCQWQPDLIYDHAVDLPNSVSLSYDYTVIGLRVKTQHASCSRKPERQELGRDLSKNWDLERKLEYELQEEVPVPSELCSLGKYLPLLVS